MSVRLCFVDRRKPVLGGCGKNLRRNAVPALLQARVRHPWRTRWSHATSSCFSRSTKYSLTDPFSSEGDKVVIEAGRRRGMLRARFFTPRTASHDPLHVRNTPEI